MRCPNCESNLCEEICEYTIDSLGRQVVYYCRYCGLVWTRSEGKEAMVKHERPEEEEGDIR